MRWTTASLTSDDGQFEGTMTTLCELRPNLPLPDLEAALSLLERACTPAAPRQITLALTKLSLLTKLKAEDGTDTTARIAAMVPLLGEFPADVVMQAIKRRQDGYVFFPSWSELRMSCQILGGTRMALRKALRDELEARRVQAA